MVHGTWRLCPEDGRITLTVQPESIYTISTTTGQSKGTFPTPPPASAPFPASFASDFDSVPTEGELEINT